jgi:hypothetical protein
VDENFEALLNEALAGETLHGDASPGEMNLDFTDDQATMWLAEKANVERKLADLNAAHASAVARLEAFTVPRRGNLAQHIGWLDEALEMYHRVKIAEGPEGNITIVLPTGVLKSGTWGGDKWVVTDQAAYDAWILANLPGAVEPQPPKIKHGEAKKLLKDAQVSDGRVMLKDGTVVPGLTIEKAERQFKPKSEFEIEREKAEKEAKAAQG